MRFHQLHALTIAASVALFASLILASGTAFADTVTSGGVDQALGCVEVSCNTQTLELNPGTPVATVLGTISLDTSTNTLEFTLTAASVSMTPVGGGSDNGVSEVLFTDVTYAASGVQVVFAGGNYIVFGGETASVAGDQTQNATTNPFSAPDARLTGQCSTSGGNLSCGLSFGQADFSFGVGDPTTQPRYFQHTMNITAAPVPEPSTLAMMGLALVGAVAAGRRS